MKLLFIVLILIVPVAAQSKPSTWDISGYVKYLSSVTDDPQVKDTLYDQLVHTRINTAWHPENSPLKGEMDVRFQAYYGDSVKRVPNFRDQVQTDYELTNLDTTVGDGWESLGYAQIDRLWLDYSHQNLEVTMGRQRIAWGTALVWNVIDLFNPKSVLDFDYEEKPGADALRVQYYTGAVSKVEVAVAPGRTRDRSTIAGFYSTNAFGYDFFAVAGIRKNHWVMGGAWAGSVWDGGFRGEFLLSQAQNGNIAQDDAVLGDSGGSAFATDNPVASIVLSADYTFANSFYIHTECLFNSNGKSEKAGEFWKQAQDSGMLSPSRWSYYQEFAYDITPLTRATIYGIFNPVDHSSIIIPMVTQSLTANLDLLVIGQFASGDRYSEYGEYGKSITLRLKYSF